MIRKQIYLEHKQERFLKQLSRKLGRSEAELIRQAIDQALAMDTIVATDLEAWEQEKAFIRRLMAQKPLRRSGRRWTVSSARKISYRTSEPLRRSGRRWTREELYEKEY